MITIVDTKAKSNVNTEFPSLFSPMFYTPYWNGDIKVYKRALLQALNDEAPNSNPMFNTPLRTLLTQMTMAAVHGELRFWKDDLVHMAIKELIEQRLTQLHPEHRIQTETESG